jgi:hypothetical protein
VGFCLLRHINCIFYNSVAFCLLRHINCIFNPNSGLFSCLNLQSLRFNLRSGLLRFVVKKCGTGTRFSRRFLFSLLSIFLKILHTRLRQHTALTRKEKDEAWQSSKKQCSRMFGKHWIQKHCHVNKPVFKTHRVRQKYRK